MPTSLCSQDAPEECHNASFSHSGCPALSLFGGLPWRNGFPFPLAIWPCFPRVVPGGRSSWRRLAGLQTFVYSRLSRLFNQCINKRRGKSLSLEHTGSPAARPVSPPTREEPLNNRSLVKHRGFTFVLTPGALQCVGERYC